jgi:hypothetical protein
VIFRAMSADHVSLPVASDLEELFLQVRANREEQP